MTEPESPSPVPPPDEQTAAAPPPVPPAQPITIVTEQPRRRGSGVFWGVVGGCLVLFLMITVAGAALTYIGRGDDFAAFSPGSRVAVVPIDGVIAESRETIEALHRYRDNGSVRAIVIRINSPGGGVVPSQEIFEEIRKVREKSGKPIVASMDSVAASGGYYIAVACDRIVANPGTLTGSIGVIAQWFNLEGLLTWARLKPETLTSGRMKDAGSPFRSVSPEERAYLQNIVTQLHGQFIDAVAQGRKGKLSRGEVEQLADGRVFTGEEARRLKLVDDLGNLQDAAKIAAGMAGLEGDPKILYPRPRRPGLLELFGESRTAKKVIDTISAGGYNFLYRWY